MHKKTVVWCTNCRETSYEHSDYRLHSLSLSLNFLTTCEQEYEHGARANSWGGNDTTAIQFSHEILCDDRWKVCAFYIS
jgi:hypothetical protein